MSHKSGKELKQSLVEAQKRVRLGKCYHHYKGQDYTVMGFVIIEATDEVGVLYQADSAGLEEISFLRPLEEFLSDVEVDGKKLPRFALVA